MVGTFVSYRRRDSRDIGGTTAAGIAAQGKKREAFRLPFGWCRTLLHVDLDLPRLGLFRLCYPDLEDTVFVAGFDAVLLRVLGQGE
jgi:hypothetical protein